MIKEKLGGWIDKDWENGCIYYEEDNDISEMLSHVRNSNGMCSKQYIMKKNPTAENMASHLILLICPELFEKSNITISKIKLYETENCYVEVSI